MLKHIRNLCLATFTVLCLSATAQAVPLLVNYQGTLYNDTGGPVSGPVTMTFGLYSVAVGGAPLWEEIQAIQVQGGVFSVLLGSVAALDSGLFDGDELWLQLAIDSQPLVPRQRLASVPYALRAATATVAQVAESVPDGAITAAKLAADVPTVAPFSNGDFVNCYSGPAGTSAVGECRSGARTWQDGSFGPCAGEVTPTAEACDDKDNNCDGFVDNTPGAPTWYRDVDLDAFGSPAASLQRCTQPEGYVARALDCDDAQNAINPLQWELCGDGIDNDCNAATTDSVNCSSGGVCSPLGMVDIGMILANCGGDCLNNPTQPHCLGCLLENGVSIQCLEAIQPLAACNMQYCDPEQLDPTCLTQNCRSQYTAAFGPLPRECLDGETRPCGSDIGVCQAGTESCNADGYWTGVCAGVVGPEGPRETLCTDLLDNDCDGMSDADDVEDCQDLDGDRYVGFEDCDDENPYVHPGALEVCGDGMDNDCNGVSAGPECLGQPCNDGNACTENDAINEDDQCMGMETFCDDGNPCTEDYCDGGGSGCMHAPMEWMGCDDGNPETEPDRCNASGQCVGEPFDADADGFAPPQDCAEGNPDINPAAFELCDGLDNDCDAQVDENVSSPLCPTQLGVCSGSVRTCGGTNGWLECTAANYGPGYQAAEASCDGLDNDCDGLTDEGCGGAGADSDGDGTVDSEDPDDDNDGVLDSVDSDPLNPYVCADSDSDSCDDCSSGFGSADIYNDGYDNDYDGLCDAGDPDDDNDGVPDGQDSHPHSQNLCSDLDNDGCNDCSLSGMQNPANDGTDVDHDGFCWVTDCNDYDNAVYPGAAEIPADGIDQDCNGFEPIYCFVDADRDGFGTSSGTTVLAEDGSCDPAQGEAQNNTDCDDDAPYINPGLGEQCFDGLDNNCNGLVDNTDPECSTECGDGICSPGENPELCPGDCNGPCGDEICNEPAENCPGDCLP